MNSLETRIKMSIINSLLDQFGVSSRIEVKDNFDVFNCSYHINLYEKIDHSIIYRLITQLKESGINSEISLTSESTDLVNLSQDSEDQLNKSILEIRDLESYLDLENDEKFKINIRINKPSTEVLDIFNHTEFCSYLNNLDIEQALEKWNKLDHSKNISIRIWEDYEGFSTKTFSVDSVFPKKTSTKVSYGIKKIKKNISH